MNNDSNPPNHPSIKEKKIRTYTTDQKEARKRAKARRTEARRSREVDEAQNALLHPERLDPTQLMKCRAVLKRQEDRELRKSNGPKFPRGEQSHVRNRAMTAQRMRRIRAAGDAEKRPCEQDGSGEHGQPDSYVTSPNAGDTVGDIAEHDKFFDDACEPGVPYEHVKMDFSTDDGNAKPGFLRYEYPSSEPLSESYEYPSPPNYFNHEHALRKVALGHRQRFVYGQTHTRLSRF